MSENRDDSGARGRALLPSIAFATLCAALALGVLGGGCAPGEGGGGSDTRSMSSEHAEAELYTCAMHPHIILNEPGNCPICGMELVPVATESGGVSDEGYNLEAGLRSIGKWFRPRISDSPGDTACVPGLG